MLVPTLEADLRLLELEGVWWRGVADHELLIRIRMVLVPPLIRVAARKTQLRHKFLERLRGIKLPGNL